jgi:hypothetical protein
MFSESLAEEIVTAIHLLDRRRPSGLGWPSLENKPRTYMTDPVDLGRLASLLVGQAGDAASALDDARARARSAQTRSDVDGYRMWNRVADLIEAQNTDENTDQHTPRRSSSA